MKFSLLLILSIIVLGCGTTRPSCISDSRESVLISWGDFDMKNKKMIHGYAIKTNMSVHKLNNLKDSIDEDELLVTTDSVYCQMYGKLTAAILKVQKLNVPAEKVRFIRYVNLETGYELNGFWNNDLKAIGSKEYREVFGILNTISPIKFEE